jgi:hypothetical protein
MLELDFFIRRGCLAKGVGMTSGNRKSKLDARDWAVSATS